MALTSDRVIVLTTSRQLAVYTVRGRLLGSYRLASRSWPHALVAYGGYALYLDGDKTVRAVKLATGADRVIARAGHGWFWNGVSLQAPGAVIPRTSQQGKAFPVLLRFLTFRSLRAAFG